MSQDRPAVEAGGIDLPARDPIVENVRADLRARSEVGLAKYGVGLDRDDLDLEAWLNHQYEELLDAALYVKRAILQIQRDRGLDSH